MKITVKQLKRLITEARSETDIDEHDGIRVGEWYVNNKGQIAPVTRIFWKDFGAHYGKLLMVDQQFATHTTSMRFDVWLKMDQRPATKDEIKDAQEDFKREQEYEEMHVNTARQGT